MELVFIITTSVLSFFSLLSNIWVTILYFKNKDLQKHPSPILACISLFEISLSHHSIALAIDSNFSVEGHGPHHIFEILTFFQLSRSQARSMSCAINQVMFAGSAAGVICYNTFFCADFIVTLRNPLFPGKKRMKIYHSLAAVIISLQVSYNIYWNLSFSECYMNALAYLYEFWNNGWLILVYFLYAIVGSCSAICCVIKMNSKAQHVNQATKEYFSRHVLYIFVLFFIYTWSAITFCINYLKNYHYEYQEHENWLSYMSTTLLSASGLAQAAIRNWERSYWTKSRDLCKRRNLNNSSLFVSSTVSSELNEDSWNLPTSFILQDSMRSNTTLCILWGIHEAIKTSSDSQKSLKVSFAKTTNSQSITNFYSFNHFIIQEHSGKTFRTLRKLEELNTEQFLNSLHPENNKKTLNSIHKAEGRSGSLFIFTEDQRWVIKIITRAEMKFFKKYLAKAYSKYLHDNKNSFLSRILGMFTIKIPGVSSLYVIVSKCVIDETVFKFYDLKGSTYHRNSVKQASFRGPFKDLDLIQENKPFKIEKREEVIKQIFKDSRFLMSCNVMDYSLLVTLRPDFLSGSYRSDQANIWLQFHIIDFLGEFSLKRKAEYYMKRIKMGKNIEMCSVMNPKSYCFRFNKFINQTLFAYWTRCFIRDLLGLGVFCSLFPIFLGFFDFFLSFDGDFCLFDDSVWLSILVEKDLS